IRLFATLEAWPKEPALGLALSLPKGCRRGGNPDRRSSQSALCPSLLFIVYLYAEFFLYTTTEGLLDCP
ncbi:hypothetical protein HKBW3S25_01605, partial [Candidatus Hakubella thermalkaliphila]